MAFRSNPTGGAMDRNWAGDDRRFHGMDSGYGPRGGDFHPGYNNGGHYQDVPPRWNEHLEDGPYQPHRNMNENYNRRGDDGHRNFAPRGRGYSGPMSQHTVQRSNSAEATEKPGSVNDVHQSGRSGEQASESVNQKRGPGTGKDQTQTSREDNQDNADEDGAQNQWNQNEQENLPQELQEDNGADSWKPLEETVDLTIVKQEPEDMDVDKQPQKGKDKAVEVDEEDEKTKAIKKLPVNHARGLMSTLIGLIGPEAQNKKPDPVPPPRPMKLEDDVEKYLGPSKHSNTAATSAISESAFLESGITASMLAEANMEINYDDRNLFPEDIGRDTSRPEFYCKLCQKQMTSLGNFRDHLNGKSHKSMLEAAKMGTKKVPKGKKKAVKPVSELGQKSVCLDVVEGATEPILGLSFITEYHSVTGVVCVCNLCSVKFDQNIVVSHTTGCKHRLRYMREKKPAVYVHLKKFGGKKSQLTTFLSDLSIGVEKEDGRGTPAIKVYHPERMDEEEDSLNQDEHENRRLINQAVKKANVDNKDLESVDFQDWVNREMRRSKELYESQKRSPSPGIGDSGRSTKRSGRQRSPSVMSDIKIRDYAHGNPHLLHRGSIPPPVFPHSHQAQMYMPPPPPQPQGFAFGRDQNKRFDGYGGQGSAPTLMPEFETRVNPISYKPDYYRDTNSERGANRQESRSHLSSSREMSETRSATLIDYGHQSKDSDRDEVRISRKSARSDDDESPPRPPARGRADERDSIPSRQLPRGREDERDTIPSRKPARGREDERDMPARKPARDREDGRDSIPSRQLPRGREDERDTIPSRKPARGREDERDEISTSRKIAKSRAETFDLRDEINARLSTRISVDEWDDASTSRQKARGRPDKREVSTSVSRADKWEDDIQQILGPSGKKGPLDGLALLSSTYSSPEEERSPSPPRKIKQTKALPFSKTYMEIMDSQKRLKEKRSRSELHSYLLDSRERNVKTEKFVEASPKARSPDVVRMRHRSPENYVDERVSREQAVHLTRRQPAQRVESTEQVYLQRDRSRSPIYVKQQKPPRSPRDSSPVRTHKKPVATTSDSATDAEAERIANLLLELSSSLSGQEDPQTALQKLFSNPDLNRALLSSKNSTAGKPSREKSSGEKMHSARVAEVGEPSGRHYASVEQPSRYMESPEESRRYASNFSRAPETMAYQEKLTPKGHAFAGSQGGRATQAAHSSRERVAFSMSAFKREESLRKSSLMNFDDDSDEL